MQHSGKRSLVQVGGRGAGSQDPPCTYSWWEPLTGCLHWSILFLQSFERTSGIKKSGGRCLLWQRPVGLSHPADCPKSNAGSGLLCVSCALFYLHTSSSLWLHLPLFTISPNNILVFFQAWKKHLLLFLRAWLLLKYHSLAPRAVGWGCIFTHQQYRAFFCSLSLEVDTQECLLNGSCKMQSNLTTELPVTAHAGSHWSDICCHVISVHAHVLWSSIQHDLASSLHFSSMSCHLLSCICHFLSSGLVLPCLLHVLHLLGQKFAVLPPVWQQLTHGCYHTAGHGLGPVFISAGMSLSGHADRQTILLNAKYPSFQKQSGD